MLCSGIGGYLHPSPLPQKNPEQSCPENYALNIGCHFGNNILFLFLQFAEKGNDLK